MKKLALVISFLFVLGAFSSCKPAEIANTAPTARERIAAMKKDTSGIPVMSLDATGGTYEFNGRKVAVWGVENDQWQTIGKNLANFSKYIEGSLYTNANTIAVHSPWKVIEPEMDVYDFTDLDYYIDQCRQNNLKIVIYFTSTNYAAGDNTFTPDYIIKDNETYSHIEMPELSGVDILKRPMCMADPDTLAREQKAAAALFGHLKAVNTDGVVLSVNIGSEIDFMHKLKLGSNKNLDIRCNCINCQKRYTEGQGNLKYMTEVFADYTKNVIDSAQTAYALPIYTPVASLMYWPGGRFVEQPDYIKQIVNRANHVVCPSVAPTQSAALYRKEMDQFVKIKGNIAFASGIDTGWASTPFNNQTHLEIAPWITMFEYNGLGAIYWDHPEMSVTKTKGTRERLRTGWGPLRAAEYLISMVKGDKDVTLYWCYENLEKTGSVGGFDIKITQANETNNGYAIAVDKNELALSTTTYKEESTNVEITAPLDASRFTFEKGYYDINGVFVKASEFTATAKGKTISFVMDGDSGDYTKAIYRIKAR